MRNSSTSPLASDSYGRVKSTPEVTTYQEPPQQPQQRPSRALQQQQQQVPSQLPLPQTKQSQSQSQPQPQPPQQGYGPDNYRKNIFSPGSNSTTSGISPEVMFIKIIKPHQLIYISYIKTTSTTTTTTTTAATTALSTTRF